MLVRQSQFEEVLLPHFAPAVGPRHVDEAGGTFQADCGVTEFGKRLQVTSRPATEIEDRERWLALDVFKQRGDILGNVVIAGALPECLGPLVVMGERQIGDLFQVSGAQFHAGSATSPVDCLIRPARSTPPYPPSAC